MDEIMEVKNVLMENILKIAEIGIDHDVDWSVAYSMFEKENAELCAGVTAEDRSYLLKYVGGYIDENGEEVAHNDPKVKLVFKKDENGVVYQVK